MFARDRRMVEGMDNQMIAGSCRDGGGPWWRRDSLVGGTLQHVTRTVR
jgi:hypothetical protein